MIAPYIYKDVYRYKFLLQHVVQHYSENTEFNNFRLKYSHDTSIWSRSDDNWLNWTGVIMRTSIWIYPHITLQAIVKDGGCHNNGVRLTGRHLAHLNHVKGKGVGQRYVPIHVTIAMDLHIAASHSPATGCPHPSIDIHPHSGAAHDLGHPPSLQWPPPPRDHDYGLILPIIWPSNDLSVTLKVTY